MLIKAGVDISRLNREIRRALNIINDVFYENDREAVITSTFGGDHSAGSLHYADDAVDVRLPGIKTVKIVSELKQRLGKRFDVVLESNHIHVEYDPK